MKKVYKRFLAILLAFAFLTVLCVPSESYAAGEFKDTGGHWASGSIQWAMSNNFLAGYPDNTFRPDRTITKAEYISLLNRSTANIAQSSAGSVDVGFNDVKKGDWYYADVQKAVKAGYIRKSSQKLNANEAITRGEAAIMLLEAKGMKGNSESAMAQYSDADRMTDPMLLAVGGLTKLKIMSGYPDGTFKPGRTLTRAEVVSMFQRYFTVTGEKPTPLTPEVNPTPNVTGDWYWTFTNEDTNFNQGYNINQREWQKVEQAARNGKLGEADVRAMESFMSEEWGGSCFGFSVTTGLYNIGKFSLADFNQGTNEIAKIKPSTDGSYAVQSALNLYMNSQALGMSNDFRGSIIHYRVNDGNRTAASFAQRAMSYIDAYKAGKGEIPMIDVYYEQGGGHSMMAYDYVVNGNTVQLKLYDNRAADLVTTSVIVDQGRNLLYESYSGNNTVVLAGRLYTAGEYLKYIGDPFNSLGAAVQKKNSKTFITVKKGSSVNVSVDNGSKVNYASNNPTQALAFNDVNLVSFRLPEGKNYAVDGAGATHFNLRMHDDLAIVKTDSVSSVQVSSNGINLAGQKGNLNVSLTNENAPAGFGHKTIRVVGKDANNLKINKSGNGFHITGDNLSNLTVSGISGSTEESIPVPAGQNSIQVEKKNGKLVIDGAVGGAPANFAGVWVDMDGNSISFAQNGNNATVTTYFNGNPFENLSGTVSGNTFTHVSSSGEKTVMVMEGNRLVTTFYNAQGQPTGQKSYNKSNGVG